MFLNKDSSIDDVCNFLKQFNVKDKIISKFREERIKGNEIFYLEKEDFVNLGYKFCNKLVSTIEETKKNQSDLLTIKEIVKDSYSEEKIKNFLKNEMKLDEQTLENFKNINGKEFKKLEKENLINLGLKIGERKKLLSYLELVKSIKENISNITNSSSIEDVCNFLKNQFNIDDEILNILKENDVDGKMFLGFTPEDIEDLNIEDEELKKNLVDYINENNTSENEINEENQKNESYIKNETPKDKEENQIKRKNEEESIKLKNNEEIFNHYQLIEIIEYITSEEEINKCPSNKIEDFIQLCEDMNIETEDNCSKINFDQANNIQIKTVTIWGTQDGLLEFFKEKKMNKTLDFLKEHNESGIILAIKEDKSFAYIIIWPGKMNFMYKRIEEPQKNLLLSLVRIGFSLSDYSVICLSKEQQNEFDFQSLEELNNIKAYDIKKGEIKFNKNTNEFFELNKKINIDFSSDELNGTIKTIKINGSLIFIYISTSEKIYHESFCNVTLDKINFKDKNIFFNENIELKENYLYDLLKKFECFSSILQNKKYIDIIQIGKERINEIKNEYKDIILNFIKKLSHNELKCQICEFQKNKIYQETQGECPAPLIQNENDLNRLYIFICNKHLFHLSHSSCINSLQNEEISNCFNESTEKEKINNDNNSEVLQKLLNIIQNLLIKNENENNTLNNMIKEFFQSFSQEDYLNKENYIEKLRQFINEFEEFINNNDKNILNEDIKFQNEKEKQKENNLNWKKEIISEINKKFNARHETMNNWVQYEKIHYDDDKNQYLFTYKVYKKCYSNCIIKLFTILPVNNEDKYLLKNKETNKWEEEKFENFFEKDKNGGILIKKENDKYRAKINFKEIEFNGCYDYNDQLKVFIITHNVKEENLEKINVFYINEDSKKLTSKGCIRSLNPTEKYSNKILLIPSQFFSRKFALFFRGEIISLTNIEDFHLVSDFNIQENYNNYSLDTLQFLVHEKFFLIVYYNEGNSIWEYDVYCINPDDEESFQKLEKDKGYFDIISKECKFSICKIKNEFVLYYCYINKDKLYIGGKKISTSSASFTIESNSDKDDNKELNFTEGNCAFNYFYHSFKKYPPFGALQYNYHDCKINNKDFYMHLFNSENITEFEDYFNELKNKCINERGLFNEDLNYNFKGIYNMKDIKDKIGLGSLIIKFIEVIPIQIAKIKNRFFKAMSNGKDINQQDLFEKYSKLNDRELNEQDKIDDFLKVNLTIKDMANYINFGIKNSIFNFYDLPVVVLVYMGVQSIGKSTLSNEIALSFFNVSGMRCTEGIWMAISLYRGINESYIQCKNKCKVCNKNACHLKHKKNVRKKINCICENCCCSEKCCLHKEEDNLKNQNLCNFRCCLPKNHEKDIAYHICEISPYSHGFICISLDFEGLGTFERSTEQDIALSMVGAAMGNSIILRVDNKYDAFMESRMLNWSEGSKKINTAKSSNFFGGHLFFCQKDVIKDNVKEIQAEFDQKINFSLSRWIEAENKRKIREINLEKLPIFGIFSKYYNSPTPKYNEKDFFHHLRNVLIDNLIKDVLIQKSLPNYRTGCEFMNSLKIILATVHMNDYNVLDNIEIENLKDYIIENKRKALEIFGIYPNNKELNLNKFKDLESHLKSNLEQLKFSFISNAKQDIIEAFNIEITAKKPKLGKHQVNFKDLLIELEITFYDYTKTRSLSQSLDLRKASKLKKNLNLINNDKKNNNNIKRYNLSNKNPDDLTDTKSALKWYNLKIEGIKEFGLLLLIPFEYKDKFNLEDIRKKLFSIWITIGNKINLSNSEMITNFSFFLEEIINRREKNIQNWLNNLTSSIKDEKAQSLRDINFSLKERWIICKEKCAACFYKCTKILGHPNEHNCGFDHKCHEKCQGCQIVKCSKYNTCNHLCKNRKAGHKKAHLCDHSHQCKKPCSKKDLRQCEKICILEFGHDGDCFCGADHLCDKFCIYKDISIGCKFQCSLLLNHEGEHICESNEHKCNIECSFKDKSRGCINGGLCILKLPHSIENHNCGGNHKCKENCDLKDFSKNCRGECVRPYGHIGEHICAEIIHKCKQTCELYGKVEGCKKDCCLKYDHETPHCCDGQHYCNKICYFKDKSRSCINEGKCILSYNHKEKCSCGEINHLCTKKCSINSCQNLCNLICEHDGDSHDCKEFHRCNKICSLKNNSKENSCDGLCIREYNHQGECLCKIPKENHKCKNLCKNCKKDCKLEGGHEGACICGECICKFDCIYKNNSHNCKNKCKEFFGHEGPHICEEKNHLCNQKCIYKDKTRKDGGCFGICCLPVNHDASLNHFCGIKKENHLCSGKCSLSEQSAKKTCYQICNKSIDHESPCLCKNSKENHKCNKECSLKGKKGCQNLCFLSVFHKGECMCFIGKDGHLCDKECSYFKNTRIGCKEKCILKYGHPEEQKCICFAELKDHIHKGECYLNKMTREGCSINCIYSVDHKGDCLCESSKLLHLCNGTCCLSEKSFENSCNKVCIQNAGHSGNHLCCSKKHECNEPCKFKSNSRSGCIGHCYKELDHKNIFKNEHVCQNSIDKHKCNGECRFKDNSRECNIYCNKHPFHKGRHLCNSKQHLCKELCIYYNKNSKGCNQFCFKKVGHTDKHICSSNAHFCNKKCHLLNVSRGCLFDCNLYKGHDGPCLCKKSKEEHLCDKKCELCMDYCCESYGHEDHHLCDKEHDCNKICDSEGCCEIITNNFIQKIIKIFQLKSSQKIEYNEENEQVHMRKKCILKIPKGKMEHPGRIHKCGIKNHKCGFKCKQCNRLCQLNYGHESYHYCTHGQIKNSYIQTEEKSIKITYQNKKYDFENEDEAIMFTCNQYCREQRRGHVHRLNGRNIKNLEENIQKLNVREIDKNLYECKCEYFWKTFLNYRFETEFSPYLIKEFYMCAA